MKRAHLFLLILPLSLSACGNETHDDLELFSKILEKVYVDK